MHEDNVLKQKTMSSNFYCVSAGMWNVKPLKMLAMGTVVTNSVGGLPALILSMPC